MLILLVLLPYLLLGVHGIRGESSLSLLLLSPALNDSGTAFPLIFGLVQAAAFREALTGGLLSLLSLLSGTRC